MWGKELPVFYDPPVHCHGLLSLCQHLLEQLGLDMGRLPRELSDMEKVNLRTVVPWTCWKE